MFRQPSDPVRRRPAGGAPPPAGACNQGRSAVAQPLAPVGGPGGGFDEGGFDEGAGGGADGGPVTLLGLHPAGGSTAFFSGWQRALGERVNLVPVRIPGRDPAGGHCRQGLPRLVAELERDLGPLLERPYLLYGHSMGALLAYRLTRRRAEHGRRLPERLLVGAYPAPHLPHPLRRATRLTDAELVSWLVDFGSLPAALRADTSWLSERIALVRAEIGLCAGDSEGFTHRPLPCPVEVFAGRDDPLVSAADAAAWAEHADGGFALHPVPGGHFFPRESKDAFFGRLGGLIAPLAAV
ncbi:hypothetical protein ATKI12_6096 [Kitasatospora sp. Ki12]